MGKVITPSTFGEMKDEELFNGLSTGEIILESRGFFEQVIWRIIKLIAEAKGRLRKRVDALEDDQKKLIKRLEVLEGKAKEVPVSKNIEAAKTGEVATVETEKKKGNKKAERVAVDPGTGA